jgi:hypothetical protein
MMLWTATLQPTVMCHSSVVLQPIAEHQQTKKHACHQWLYQQSHVCSLINLHAVTTTTAPTPQLAPDWQDIAR